LFFAILLWSFLPDEGGPELCCFYFFSVEVGRKSVSFGNSKLASVEVNLPSQVIVQVHIDVPDCANVFL